MFETSLNWWDLWQTQCCVVARCTAPCSANASDHLCREGVNFLARPKTLGSLRILQWLAPFSFAPDTVLPTSPVRGMAQMHSNRRCSARPTRTPPARIFAPQSELWHAVHKLKDTAKTCRMSKWSELPSVDRLKSARFYCIWTISTERLFE